MNTNHATFVKPLGTAGRASLYRLSSAVAIYDNSGATTDHVIVRHVSAPASNAFFPERARSRPCPPIVAVYPADLHGNQYESPHLVVLVGAEQTDDKALAAIGFPTVVFESDSAADANGTYGARFEMRDGVLHLQSITYQTHPAAQSTAQEILEETYAPAAAQHPTFMEYCETIYPECVFPQHFEVAGEQVEKLVAGDVTRAQTNMPPQHGSTTLALLGLAYALGCNPEKRYAYVTYDGPIPDARGRQVRKILLSDAHLAMFPNFALDASYVAAGEVCTVQGGGAIFVSTRAGMTGRSLDGVVIDSPFRDLNARLDEAQQEKFNAFFEGAILARCRESTWVHLINARLGSDWKHAGANWKWLNFPALSPEGLALLPEFQTRELALAKKASMKPYHWELFYQQNVDGFKFRM